MEALERTTSVFIWEALAESLAACEQPTIPISTDSNGRGAESEAMPPNPADEEEVPDFDWRPPDLSHFGDW